MYKTSHRFLSFFLSAMLIASLGLFGCSTSAPNDAQDTAGAVATSTDGAPADAQGASDDASEGSAQEAEYEPPYGKPWQMTIDAGNLPSEKPAAKDDAYTHYNYEYLTDHQNEQGSAMEFHASEIIGAVLEVINDESKSGHDLEQMRLLYNQAADLEAQEKIGLSEIQPYIDRIQDAKSVEDLNEVLTSEDFPFTPFITATVSGFDMTKNTAVCISPSLVFSDGATAGGTYYQDAESEEVENAYNSQKIATAVPKQATLYCLDKTDEEIQETMSRLLQFETAYAKYADYNGKWTKGEYGAYTDELKNSVFTLDELCALCPNVPIRGMLKNCLKDTSERYSAVSSTWLEKLSEAWTDENLETIKDDVLIQMLSEVSPYYESKEENERRAAAGLTTASPDSETWEAIDKLDAFDSCIGKIYVDEVLGQKAKERLTNIAGQLVSTYRDLFSNTAWLDEESKARVIDKIENMNLNILEPQGGFRDYGGVDLVSTEDGGTPFSNYLKLKQYRNEQDAKHINQSALPTFSWEIVKATTTNCFYDATNNSINILPGFITSLVYADDMSDAELLGKLGFVIGHEMSHGFDFLGSQVNAQGQGESVFTDAVLTEFEERTNKLADYYDTLEIVPGFNVDGQKVKVEAAADLCGTQAIIEIASKEGYDFEEIIAAFADLWADVEAPGTAKMMSIIDEHPLVNHRTNVCFQMFDALYDQIGVKEGDGMYLAPDQRINIWGEKA